MKKPQSPTSRAPRVARAPLRYGRYREAAHRDAVVRLLHEGYATPLADVPAWLAKIGEASLRVASRGREVAACLVLLPMGQVFGGRVVPMCGVAGVAVAPEARGEGVALATVRAAMRDMRASGHALSTLYPSTESLYRRAGYEVAGARWQVTLDAGRVALRAGEGASDLRVRRVEPVDHPAVERLHRARAARSSGELERGAYIWDRVRAARGEPTTGFVVERDGGSGSIEGYAFFVRRMRDDGLHDLRVTDLVASTPRASARLLAFFRDQRSTVRDVVTFVPPDDVALSALAEAPSDVGLEHVWMTRVLDTPRALAARGYAKALRGELHLDVRDADGLARGAWVLAVDAGGARVREGGRRSVRLDASALAPLFTGWSSAEQLAARGAIEGKAADLALASALFAGPKPTLVDYF